MMRLDEIKAMAVNDIDEGDAHSLALDDERSSTRGLRSN
jgi:hypothetical protein